MELEGSPGGNETHVTDGDIRQVFQFLGIAVVAHGLEEVEISDAVCLQGESVDGYIWPAFLFQFGAAVGRVLQLSGAYDAVVISVKFHIAVAHHEIVTRVGIVGGFMEHGIEMQETAVLEENGAKDG